ncbi:MAG: ATP-binding cassette domain-containing protein, partial [Proteobacteria bacterium]|nr:ATP-binding cassette domain-containing protein [Pseudomonadota bacterium]
CYMPPTSGTVEVDGYSIDERSLDVRRKIGYLPEMNPLYLDMNVLEYLEYSARLHGLSSTTLAGRLNEMVEVCGLRDVRHKDIGELSKGYRQRVGLAQAMIHDPDVLILDEPTSGLDPNQIVEIRNLIRQLGRAKTVVLSTHILSEVQATCDRIIIIHQGSIVADGTPDKLQRDFEGTETVSLEVKTPSANAMTDLLPKLQTVSNVQSVEFTGSTGDRHRFMVNAAKGNDVRQELFRRAVSEQWTILEMVRRSTSLEEVFHALTRVEQ